MAKRLSRIERDIERLKEKISEYQQQLKELEAAKTEQENLQIIQLVLVFADFFFEPFDVTLNAGKSFCHTKSFLASR